MMEVICLSFHVLRLSCWRGELYRNAVLYESDSILWESNSQCSYLPILLVYALKNVKFWHTGSPFLQREGKLDSFIRIWWISTCKKLKTVVIIILATKKLDYYFWIRPQKQYWRKPCFSGEKLFVGGDS